MFKAIRMMAIAAAVLAACGGAWAQDNTGDEEIIKELRTNNPHIATVESRARALVTPLSQPQMQTLFMMREGYGLIRSVETVQRDIGRAVNLCGKDNPDLKKPMDDRFKSWRGNVQPVLDERMKALQAAIDAQNFTAPGRIREYFKALDDAAAYAEKKFDKRVVTTPEACKSLLESMSNSEERVVSIMKDLRVPEIPAPAATKQD